MPPNLRCVVAQGWRSTRSRRNFSSSSGSNGETESFYEDLKLSVYPSFKTFKFMTWAMYGYAGYGFTEVYQFCKLYPKLIELRDYNWEQGWRSSGSRREFTSSRGRHGETESFYEALKSLYKNPDSKGSIEFKEKLTERFLAVLTGLFVGFATIKTPSRRIARRLEEEMKVFEEMQSKGDELR
ncbi:unnamed protein product [Microthlaspi erraticum]|uniref:Uncharacterized protein n=1 Tax=Microthlaspi erraticum TaxID=1685480 RepID=A0A6D2JJ58_9BRAS|nr:unnamed protein product [Microthlaspi erraticum]